MKEKGRDENHEKGREEYLKEKKREENQRNSENETIVSKKHNIYKYIYIKPYFSGRWYIFTCERLPYFFISEDKKSQSFR